MTNILRCYRVDPEQPPDLDWNRFFTSTALWDCLVVDHGTEILVFVPDSQRWFFDCAYPGLERDSTQDQFYD